MIPGLTKLLPGSEYHYSYWAGGEHWLIYDGACTCIIRHDGTNYTNWIVGDVARAVMLIQNMMNDPSGYWLKYVYDHKGEP